MTTRRTEGRRRGGRYLIPLLVAAILGVAACSSGGSSGGSTSAGGTSGGGKHTATVPEVEDKDCHRGRRSERVLHDLGQVAQTMSKQLGVTVTYVVPPTPT